MVNVYMKMILDHIPDMTILVTSVNGHVLYANENGEKLLEAMNWSEGKGWKAEFQKRFPECKMTEIPGLSTSDAILITLPNIKERKNRSIYMRTFGHFDVFINEKPVIFKSAKAKELLALLVDRRGGTVNSDQIIAALWENRPNNEATQNLCSKVVKALHNELEKLGIEDILVTSRGIRYLDITKFKCDLYEMLDGNEEARRNFYGEYLMDYSWAEDRIAMLLPYIERINR